MNTIPSIIPLAIGIAAGLLFLAVFVGSMILTLRNRCFVRRNATRDDTTDRVAGADS